MNQRLTNKVALITGGGSWIGKEIATVFASAGAKVFILGRNIHKLEQTVKEITASGGTAACISADISQEESIHHAVAEAIRLFGRIDIAVQNAAIYPPCLLDNMTLTHWKSVIDINLTGSFIVLRAVDKIMKQHRHGKIIFISSIAGDEIGLTGYGHYTASKAGMSGLMRTAALELAEHNITINSINPGNILNQEIFNATEDKQKEMLHKIPLRRFGKPIDVAMLALFLASDESNFITGQNFIVDGGETIGST